MATKKTDNSYLQEKINLRWISLPDQDDISVLDCYAGTGKIWKGVKKISDKNIRVLPIDKCQLGPTTLKGDNLKYLKNLNLDAFDIIDLDAYGIPFAQCETIFKKKFRGIVHVTIIQSLYGNMPDDIFPYLGYSIEMIKKCKTIFNIDGTQKMLDFFAINGVKSIRYIDIDKKFYGYFNTKGDEI